MARTSTHWPPAAAGRTEPPPDGSYARVRAVYRYDPARNAVVTVNRVGEKGSIVGAPIKKGAVLFEGPAKVVAASTIPYYGFGFRFFPYAEDREDRMHLRISNITTASA